MIDEDREQLEADRRYNDALAALDRALVGAAGLPVSAPAFDTAAPALPVAVRHPLVRIVYRWLAPFFERQQAINGRVAVAIGELIARERERQASFERFQTALIVFLQQITAFVETKDRAIVARTGTRLEEQEQSLSSLPDLSARVGARRVVGAVDDHQRLMPEHLEASGHADIGEPFANDVVGNG